MTLKEFTPNQEVWIYYSPTVFYEGEFEVEAKVVETVITQAQIDAEVQAAEEMRI